MAETPGPAKSTPRNSPDSSISVRTSIFNTSGRSRAFSFKTFLPHHDIGSIVSLPPETRVIHVVTENNSDRFLSLKIRHNFIRKVYAILGCQFAFKVIFLVVVKFVCPISIVFEKYAVILLSTFIFNYLVLAVYLMFVSDFIRNFPINAILMTLLTLSLAVHISALSFHFDILIPALYATGLATIVFFTIVLSTLQTRIDVTTMNMCCCLIVYITAICGITVAIMKTFHTMIIVTSIVILLFVLWLIHITRETMADRHDEVMPEEYIFGALTCYVYFLFIFLFIIELIKYCRKI